MSAFMTEFLMQSNRKREREKEDPTPKALEDGSPREEASSSRRSEIFRALSGNTESDPSETEICLVAENSYDADSVVHKLPCVFGRKVFQVAAQCSVGLEVFSGVAMITLMLTFLSVPCIRPWDLKYG